MWLGVKKLIYTSSAAAVIDGRGGRTNERDYEINPPKVSNIYQRTKFEAERLVLKANEVCGLKTIALRPCVLIGEEDKYLMDAFVKDSGFTL